MIESPLLPRLEAYFGGNWTTADSPRNLRVTNPADGSVLAELPMWGAQEAQSAIEAAAAANAGEHSLAARREWLEGIATRLTENRRELGRIICLENGKPWKEAEGEVEYAVSFFRYAATHLQQLRSRRLREHPRDHRWVVHYRPVGVAALIVPWNFPLAMTAKKLAATLAAGAPCVIKPAALTPLTSIALMGIIDSLGLPSGMVNLVIGESGPIGRVFCEHPAVRSISFTGSTEVGQILLRQAAPQIKRLTLELGGNAPFILCADADLDSAVEHLIQNKFRCAGQTCVCANRVYVASAVAAAFTEKLVRRVSELKVGDGLQPDSDLGPLINRAGFEKVRGHMEDAVQRGARCETGELPPEPDRDWGLFFPPTVLSGVPADARCVSEETFGPLVPLIEFDTESQVIEWANGTEAGLAAYLFTADAQRARRMIRQLHFGHVGHNSGTGPTAEAPFGGMKFSGFGREGGREGLMEFVEPQTVPST